MEESERVEERMGGEVEEKTPRKMEKRTGGYWEMRHSFLAMRLLLNKLYNIHSMLNVEHGFR